MLPIADMSDAMGAIVSLTGIVVAVGAGVAGIVLLTFFVSALAGILELRRHWMAAHQGHAPSQYFIAMLHHTGDRVPKSLVDAHMWYGLAASQGHSEAARARDEIAPAMTSDEIARATERAEAWTPSDRAPRLRARRA